MWQYLEKRITVEETNNLFSFQPTAAKAGKKPEIASVLAPYQATGPEQLSLTPGQLIQVRKKSTSGWWEGELQVGVAVKAGGRGNYRWVWLGGGTTGGCGWEGWWEGEL